AEPRVRLRNGWGGAQLPSLHGRLGRGDRSAISLLQRLDRQPVLELLREGTVQVLQPCLQPAEPAVHLRQPVRVSAEPASGNADVPQRRQPDLSSESGCPHKLSVNWHAKPRPLAAGAFFFDLEASNHSGPLSPSFLKSAIAADRLHFSCL